MTTSYSTYNLFHSRKENPCFTGTSGNFLVLQEWNLFVWVQSPQKFFSFSLANAFQSGKWKNHLHSSANWRVFKLFTSLSVVLYLSYLIHRYCCKDISVEMSSLNIIKKAHFINASWFERGCFSYAVDWFLEIYLRRIVSYFLDTSRNFLFRCCQAWLISIIWWGQWKKWT